MVIRTAVFQYNLFMVVLNDHFIGPLNDCFDYFRFKFSKSGWHQHLFLITPKLSYVSQTGTTWFMWDELIVNA